MRYRITTYPIMAGHLVVIAGSPDHDDADRIVLQTVVIPYEDLKVDDLLHLLEAVWREVGAVTP